jgi:hypothetical protein
MVTILVKEIAPEWFSNDDGQRLYDVIAPHILNNEPVTVSFKDVPSATTSFINSAFISLLDTISFDKVKTMLKIVDSNTHLNRLIKDRFASAQALNQMH